jgi:dTDP-4-amino-4,6-dideoxygalactose transaminase
MTNKKRESKIGCASRSLKSSWPVFGQEEIDAVSQVLKSGHINYWTGKEGRLFEQEFAEYIGSKYAVALANGTVALELALESLGVGQGDEVVVTPRSFIASVSCVVTRGAIPVFADVDRDSQNITVESIKAVITPKTKAVIVVHLSGWPCDMDPIMDLAEQHGIKVIEDCAQAHGAKYKGRTVGTIGHISAFSFCNDKIMPAGGEGGMLCTNDEKIWNKAWAYKDHGKSWDAVYNREHPPGYRWLHESFGTNWRMTEMQAAIGRVVLRKLPEWVNTRRRNAAILDTHFSDIPILRVTIPNKDYFHTYWRYFCYLEEDKIKASWSRERIMNEMQQRDIEGHCGYGGEIYQEKAFDDTNWRPSERLPVARELAESSLLFYVHPTLTEKQMQAKGSIACSVLLDATK